MEDGLPGHHGAHALKVVEPEIKQERALVLNQHL
jgi:hypothetical protein